MPPDQAPQATGRLTRIATSIHRLAGRLQINGPAVLLHLCNGFPYGPRWTPLTADAHAVVLTAVDSGAGTATFNNPWGDKDQAIDLQTLVTKINARPISQWVRHSAFGDRGWCEVKT
jgi:hypothetical protein